MVARAALTRLSAGAASDPLGEIQHARDLVHARHPLQDAAHANGLYLRSIPPDRISFMPPLIIDEDEIAEALKRLRKALDSVWNELRQ